MAGKVAGKGDVGFQRSRRGGVRAGVYVNGDKGAGGLDKRVGGVGEGEFYFHEVIEHGMDIVIVKGAFVVGQNIGGAPFAPGKFMGIGPVQQKFGLRSVAVRKYFMMYIKHLGDIVGDILKTIDDAGLAEDTLIIATTDHGVPFPGLKCHLTKHGTGVYLIKRGPKGFDGGKVIDGLVSQIDIYPTLCELLELEKPEWLEGVSVMPLVAGKRGQIHDQIFGEVNYHATYEPMRSIRTPRYLYVRRFGPRSRPLTCNWDGSPSKDLWLNDGIANRPLPEEMLFDTFYDHEEMNNLALDPTYEHILEELGLRLVDWMERTDDPLLNGTVPAPENATITALDAVEPRQAQCAPPLEAAEYTRVP